MARRHGAILGVCCLLFAQVFLFCGQQAASPSLKTRTRLGEEWANQQIAKAHEELAAEEVFAAMRRLRRQPAWENSSYGDVRCAAYTELLGDKTAADAWYGLEAVLQQWICARNEAGAETIFPHRKPSPVIFEEAFVRARNLGWADGAWWHVGDDLAIDVAAASRLGLRTTVYVDRPERVENRFSLTSAEKLAARQAEADSEPDLTVASLRGLADKIQSRINGLLSGMVGCHCAGRDRPAEEEWGLLSKMSLSTAATPPELNPRSQKDAGQSRSSSFAHVVDDNWASGQGIHALSRGAPAEVMEFHLRVPPEKWCITKAEFFAFVEEVRSLWESGTWKIDWHATSHSGGSYGSSSTVTRRFTQLFQDEVSGPNLYEVNERFVKPLTREAGGMSYALMKHPDGLLCQVFISHAWAEGQRFGAP
eukprot:s32_g4.t1